MADGGEAEIDEFWDINLGTTKDPKLIFVSVVLIDEEMAQYEELL